MALKWQRLTERHLQKSSIAPCGHARKMSIMPNTRLLHAFSTFSIGGAQTRFARLTRALGPEFQHIVTSMDRRFDTMRLISDVENVESFDIPSTRGRNLNNVARFASALRTIQPDRVVTYNFGSIEWAFASALLRLPHLHIEDGFGPEESEKRLLRRSFLRSVALYLSRGTLITISNTLARVARQEWHIPENRILLIPNGVEPDQFELTFERARISRFATQGQVVIGVVAALRPEKRLDRLLKAVAALPPELRFILVIAGEGTLRPDLENLANSLGIRNNTVFLGQVDRVQDLYGEFDIFALSSDTEQLPMVLLEAMAAGLPVASTDVGDIRDTVGPANKKWLCPRDERLLGAVLLDMIRSPDERTRVGQENARRVREHYLAASMLESWKHALQT
jgi:glycosyltransferase involved in cell wall biosynthesis